MTLVFANMGQGLSEQARESPHVARKANLKLEPVLQPRSMLRCRSGACVRVLFHFVSLRPLHVGSSLTWARASSCATSRKPALPEIKFGATGLVGASLLPVDGRELTIGAPEIPLVCLTFTNLWLPAPLPKISDKATNID